MLVVVYQGTTVHNRQATYIEVDGVANSDQARKVAFRHVYKHVEKDYSELINNTSMPAVVTVGKVVADTLLSFVG